MIVLDSSALISIILAEPTAERCVSVLETSEELFISTVTVTEFLIVAARRNASSQAERFLERYGVVTMPVDARRALAAAAAYRRWGKGFHRAKLNLGDSFAYALAKELDCPLLFIGNDFAETDVISALA